MRQEIGKLALPHVMVQKVAAITFLALFGLTLVYGIGFAHSHLLHNATHDVRHGAGYPCH